MPRGMRAASPDWSTDAGRPVDPTAPHPRRADSTVATPQARPVEPTAGTSPLPLAAAQRTKRFTAVIDTDTDERYARLLQQLRGDLGPIATREDGYGHTRAGYDLSRADLLRALLAVADDQPDVLTAVAIQLQHHYAPTSLHPTASTS